MDALAPVSAPNWAKPDVTGEKDTPQVPRLQALTRMSACAWAGLVLFVAAAAFGVFVLPWHGPRPRPADALSCTYGFSNFIAWAWVALMLALLTAYRLWRAGRTGECPSRAQQQPKGQPLQNTACVPAPEIATAEDARAPAQPWETALSSILPATKRARNRPLFVAFAFVVVLTLVLVIGWFWYLPYAYFGETKLFISRFEAMLMGLRPYRDFTFTYGPAMLYLPYGIYRLFGGYFSVEQVYGLTLGLHWAGGLYLAYYIVSRLGGSFGRALIFLLLVVPCINISLGLNYTLLRFLLPMASVLALHQLVSKWGGDSLSPPSTSENTAGVNEPSLTQSAWLRIALAGFLVPLVNFAFSPEMGVAAWLGCIAYFVHLWRTPLRRLTPCVAGVLLALPAVALLFSQSYFDSIFSFSGGGLSFPVFPSLHMILFLVALFCVAPVLASFGLRSRETQGSIALALCLVTGLLVVPAMGRCDPAHLLFNGFGILLLFLAGLSHLRGRTFKVFATLFIVAWGILGFGTTYFLYRPLVKMAIETRAQTSRYSRTAANDTFHYSKMQPISIGYKRLLDYPQIGLPVGAGEDLERYLKLTGKFVPDYRLCPCQDIFVPAQLEQKLTALRSMKYIVIPSLFLEPLHQPSPEALAKADSKFLSRLLWFPVNLHPSTPLFTPNRQIAEEIRTHYKMVQKVTDLYLLMERRDT